MVKECDYFMHGRCLVSNPYNSIIKPALPLEIGKNEALQAIYGEDLCEQLNITKEDIQIMEQQTNWLDQEIAELTANTNTTFEKLPSLKLLPNKIVEVEVDFSQPFQKWADRIHKSTKAIIPVTSAGTKMNFWLNVKNPLYAQICTAGKNKQTKFKIIQTGTAQDTKYNLVD